MGDSPSEFDKGHDTCFGWIACTSLGTPSQSYRRASSDASTCYRGLSPRLSTAEAGIARKLSSHRHAIHQAGPDLPQPHHAMGVIFIVQVSAGWEQGLDQQAQQARLVVRVTLPTARQCISQGFAHHDEVKWACGGTPLTPDGRLKSRGCVEQEAASECLGRGPCKTVGIAHDAKVAGTTLPCDFPGALRSTPHLPPHSWRRARARLPSFKARLMPWRGHCPPLGYTRQTAALTLPSEASDPKARKGGAPAPPVRS